MKTQRIDLTGPLELNLPDGTTLTLRPGPYGKGISILTAAAKKPPGTISQGRGRPARPSTTALREMLQTDAAAGRVREARHYLDWLTKQEPNATATSLQQIVYREIRVATKDLPRKGKRTSASKRAASGKTKGGSRGRQPHPATISLRERLAKDAPELKDAQFYIRWLVDNAGLGLRKARPIVYRELRLAR